MLAAGFGGLWERPQTETPYWSPATPMPSSRREEQLKPFDANGAFHPVAKAEGVRRAAVRGASVTILASGVSFVVQMAATVVLARLLTPADFGVVTMVTTFSLLLSSFGMNGFSELILQREEVTHFLVSNLFWIKRGIVCTPPLADGVLPGVTRLAVLEICRALNFETREVAPRPKELFSAQGVFLSMSSWGIVEAVGLDGRKLRRAACVKKIQRGYEQLLRDVTA